MQKMTTLLSLGLTLLLIGCGGTTSDNDDNTKTTQSSISIPKEISIDIPKALKNSSETQEKTFHKFQKDADTKSIGYEQLKDDIEELELIKEELEINLLMANELIGEIETRCQSIPLGTTCTIKENELYLDFDSELVEEINELTSEDSNELIEETIPLGTIEFTQYDASQSFQYALKIDIPNEEGSEPSTQTIKWSKDENLVQSSYSYEDDYSKDNMTLTYIKKANGEKEMRSDNIYFDKEFNSQGDFQFTIIEKTNAHYIVNSEGKNNSIFDGQTFNSTFLSQGEISENGGFLNFSGIFDGQKFEEREIFDANGNSISSKYCDALSECDLQDESTWLTFGDEDFEIEENFEIDVEEFEFIELTATGGNLQEGEYLLLAPNTDINGKSEIEIFQSVVGDLFVFDGEIFASLNSSTYSNQLNSLVLASITFSEEQEIPKASFEVIAEADRPTLTIATNDEIEYDEDIPLLDFDENLTFPEDEEPFE